MLCGNWSAYDEVHCGEMETPITDFATAMEKGSNV